MRSRKPILLPLLCLALTASPAVAAGGKTIQVDCAKGDKIATALEEKASPLTVEIHGVCTEEVVVRRDNITLRGGSPGAAIIGPDTPIFPFGGAITVAGASEVTVTDLILRDGRRGMTITNGGSAILQRVTLQDNLSTGLSVFATSSAELTDCVAQRNGRFGIAAWDNSEVDLQGSVSANDNGIVGILLSASHAAGSSSLTVSVEANDNGLVGIVLQIGGTAQLNASVSGDQLLGLWIIVGSSYAGDIEASGNDIWGLALETASVFEGSGSIVGNGCLAVEAIGNSTFLFNGDSSGNPCGLALDGVHAGFTDSTVSDHLSLSFGTQVDFAGSNSFTGGVSCDGTVLTRGDVSCPAPLAQAGPTASGLARAARGRLPREPFRSAE